MNIERLSSSEPKIPNESENNTAFGDTQALFDNISVLESNKRDNDKKIGMMQDEVEKQPGLASAITARIEENRITDLKIQEIRKQIRERLGNNN